MDMQAAARAVKLERASHWTTYITWKGHEV
jgi:hypothetical protein